MLFCLFLIIIIIYTIVALYKTGAYIYIYFKLKNVGTINVSDNKGEYPYTFLLVPGLREQSLVEETITYFNKFNYPREKLKVMIITTEKENNQKEINSKRVNQFCDEIYEKIDMQTIINKNKGLFPKIYLEQILDIITSKPKEIGSEIILELYNNIPLTSDLASKYVDKMNNESDMPIFIHVHYPKTEGGKPSQLNYAISLIEEQGYVNDINAPIYIGVYDFDSRPDLRTGQFIANEIISRKRKNLRLPAMFQQTQLPLSGFYMKVKGKFNQAILKGNTIIYIRRALGIELFKIYLMNLVNSKNNNWLVNAFFRPVVYGIGSGMYVNLDTLKSVNYFPEPQEDLAMGYRMCMLGEEIIPISYLNFMQPYDSCRQMINAFSMTFNSALCIHKEKNITKNLTPKKVLNNFEKNTLIVKEWVECIIWLIGVPILIFTYISFIFIYKISVVLLLIIIIPIFIRTYFDMYFLAKSIDVLRENYKGQNENKIKYSFMEKFLILLLAPIHGLIRIMSPIKGVYLIIKKYIFNSCAERTKTER